MLDVLEANELLERAEELNRGGQYRELIKVLDSIPKGLFRLSPELYVLRGRANIQLGHFKRGLASLQRVRQLGYIDGNTALSRRHRNLVGVAAVQLGNLTLAEGCFREVAEMANVAGDRRELAIAWMNLGVVSDIQCEWESALASYQRALTELERLGDQGRSAQCQHNIAITYRQLDRFDEAEAHFAQALTGLVRYASASDILRFKAERALLVQRRGDDRFAAHMAFGALAEAEAMNDLPCEAELLRVCGIISRSSGSAARAEELLRRSLRIARRVRAGLLEAEVYEELAACKRSLGDPKAAERHLARAARRYEILGAEIRARIVKRRLIDLVTSEEY